MIDEGSYFSFMYLFFFPFFLWKKKKIGTFSLGHCTEIVLSEWADKRVEELSLNARALKNRQELPAWQIIVMPIAVYFLHYFISNVHPLYVVVTLQFVFYYLVFTLKVLLGILQPLVPFLDSDWLSWTALGLSTACNTPLVCVGEFHTNCQSVY